MHILMRCKILCKSFHQQTSHMMHNQFWKMLKDISIHSFLIKDHHKYHSDRYCSMTYQSHQIYKDWECCLLSQDQSIQPHNNYLTIFCKERQMDTSHNTFHCNKTSMEKRMRKHMNESYCPSMILQDMSERMYFHSSTNRWQYHRHSHHSIKPNLCL